MAHIIVPAFGGRKPTATIRIVSHEGARLEIVVDFDPPLKDERSWRQNPAASAAVDILMAAKMKGVIAMPSLGKGGGVGAEITQSQAREAGHFDRETIEG